MIFLKKGGLLLLLLVLTIEAFGQMPGWKFFLDGDGNTYFLNKNKKIFITSEIKRMSQPVTVRGLEYYLAAVKDLIKNHRNADALRIVKTILAMKPLDQRVITAQQKAILFKHFISRQQGTRYAGINREASPLIFRNSPDKTILLNENMHYSLETMGILTLLKNTKRRKPSYYYQGILMGVSFEPLKEGDSTLFDCLFAIDAERFAIEINDIDEFEKSWYHRNFLAAGKREAILRGEKASLYRFLIKGSISYTGYEGFIINGRFGYFFRIIAPGDKKSALEKKLKSLALSIKISKI